MTAFLKDFFRERKPMVLKHTPLGEINLPFVAMLALGLSKKRRFHAASTP